jgi:hypothetical protein
VIGRLLCAWRTEETATTARFRLAWVVGHDRAATFSRFDVPAPAIPGFWTGVQAAHRFADLWARVNRVKLA